MKLWRPKRVYFDPYGVQEEFPAGLYEIWVVREGYEAVLEGAILSRGLSREVFWEKRHMLLRFYVGKAEVVMAWKKTASKWRASRMKNILSVGMGRLTVNIFVNGKEEK